MIILSTLGLVDILKADDNCKRPYVAFRNSVQRSDGMLSWALLH
jgi:hypothetical protein